MSYKSGLFIRMRNLTPYHVFYFMKHNFLIYVNLCNSKVHLLFEAKNSSLAEFQVEFLDVFHHFLETNSFRLFWMWIPCVSIQLMSVFGKFPFLVLCCTFYTLLIFLMMLFVILPCILLLSMLIVIRLLIFGSN